MDRVKEYLMTICAAAIICGIIVKLIPQQGTHRALVKLLCGLFMVINALSPGISFPIFDLKEYFDQLNYESERIVASGEDSLKEETDRVMQQYVQSYIQEKAKTLGADVYVEATVINGIPHTVHVQGAVSPYIKKQLSQYIFDQLGILPEDQLWNMW